MTATFAQGIARTLPLPESFHAGEVECLDDHHPTLEQAKVAIIAAGLAAGNAPFPMPVPVDVMLATPLKMFANFHRGELIEVYETVTDRLRYEAKIIGDDGKAIVTKDPIVGESQHECWRAATTLVDKLIQHACDVYDSKVDNDPDGMS